MSNGIRAEAEPMSPKKRLSSNASKQADGGSSGYGRARLWLGISAVGTLVTSACLLLSLDIAGVIEQRVDSTISGQMIGLAVFVLSYSAIQFPFDVLGGYLLPKHFGRSHPRFFRYLLNLCRGVIVHATLLFISAIGICFAGRWGGSVGTAAAGLIMSTLLLAGRSTLATLMASLKLVQDGASNVMSGDALHLRFARSMDEGFTGGIVGVLHARLQIIPAQWRELLSPEGFEIAVYRRSIAVNTGIWRRGRNLAILFTAAGLTISTWLVAPMKLGTVGGTIEFSLWFTLWSFVGLLSLPTPSRRGVIEIDEVVNSEGNSSEALRTMTRLLDELQDGEPVKPTFVETIFHPIPSVRTRLEGPRSSGVIGFWDAARTSIYLSLAGLGLLGRAVHCNCGRPALWVFLPTD